MTDNRAFSPGRQAFRAVPGRTRFAAERPSPSWSAKPATHEFFGRLDNTTKRGWSAFADHDG